MRAAWWVLGLVLVWPVAADDFWSLRKGPESVEGIPLHPIQPVASWRGLYDDGDVQLWVYATNSPYFVPPDGVLSRRIEGTPWSVVGFFPPEWTPAQQGTWLDHWVADFQSLQTLPHLGWPVVFPAILKKG